MEEEGEGEVVGMHGFFFGGLEFFRVLLWVFGIFFGWRRGGGREDCWFWKKFFLGRFEIEIDRERSCNCVREKVFEIGRLFECRLGRRLELGKAERENRIHDCLK